MPKLSTRLQRFRTGSPLSFRLLAWILLFSSAFTLISSALQIYSDYRKDLLQIDNRMQVVESGYASSLARSLWALDQKLLQTQLEGVLSLPDIVHLRLKIEPDSELVLGRIPRDTTTTSHSFELIHQDDSMFILGELTVTADLRRAYADMEQ